MTDAIRNCSANETAACCCVDVGTVMDNTDCSASWSGVFADRQAAEAMLAELSAKARQLSPIRARFIRALPTKQTACARTSISPLPAGRNPDFPARLTLIPPLPTRFSAALPLSCYSSHFFFCYWRLSNTVNTDDQVRPVGQ